MDSKFSCCARVNVCSLIALMLFSGQAVSNLVILSNDSSISVDATAEVYEDTIDFFPIFDSQSTSDSVNFVSQTANPGSFGDSLLVSATATDPDSRSVTWSSRASLNVDITNPAADQVRINGGGFGQITYSNPLFTPNDEGLGGGSAVARMDLIFSIDVPYVFDISGEHNTPSSNKFSWALVDTGTGTQVVGNPFVNDGTFSDSAMISAGTYQLFGEYKLNNNYYTSTGSSYSSFFIADFTEDISTVPVPASIWLFGSGVLGLLGMARRKKA